ncbi:MAG: hypothetical protein AB7L36_00730 [Sphingomonadaceae bacterium]
MIHTQIPRAEEIEADEWARCERDALQSLSNLPDPAETAGWLPTDLMFALCRSIQTQGALRILDEDAEYRWKLRLCGLVEINGPCLTAFGFAVRRVFLEREED